MILRLIMATIASIAHAAAWGWAFPRVPEWAAYPVIMLMLGGSFALWYVIAVGVRRGT